MTNEKTIKITVSDNISTWYLDTEGDLFRTRDEAEVCGVATTVLADCWYPGSFDEWKKSILNQLN